MALPRHVWKSRVVKARNARAVTNYMGADATVYDQIPAAITSEFVGYDTLTCESKITVLTTETELTEALTEGDARYGDRR